MGIHWQELVVILVIVLVLFGPKRLPEIGSSLGRGIRGFRDSLNGTEQPVAGSPEALLAGRADAGNGATAAAVAVPVEVVEPTPAAGDGSTRA